MGDYWGVDTGVLVVSNVIITLVLAIFMIVMFAKLRAAKRRYRQLLNGDSPFNVEQVLIQIQDKLNKHQDEIAAAHEKSDAISNALRKMKSKVGIHRYNAFADSGSDLSFTLAFLDEYQDGVIITGIHSREQTYMYAKPIEQGASSYTLSPEEKEAIRLTLLHGRSS